MFIPQNPDEQDLFYDIRSEFGTWISDITRIEDGVIYFSPQSFFKRKLAEIVAGYIREDWEVEVVVEWEE